MSEPTPTQPRQSAVPAHSPAARPLPDAQAPALSAQVERRQFVTTQRRRSLRWSIIGLLFGLLYRSRTLYWLASTIPFAGQWRVWQRLVLPRLIGSDVLEVGCGIGKLLADMVQAGYTCAAIDRSPQMVAATRAELRRRGLSLEATPVRQATVQRLPFADAAFDSVVSTFPTDYIYDPAAQRELARVLRPGGRLIVVLGAALLPQNALLLPFVAIQTLVYGRAPQRRRRTTSNKPANPATEATESGAGQALYRAMATAALTAHSEHVRGPIWDAYLVIGEKPHP